MLLSREKEISEFLSEYNGDDVTILFSGAGTSSFIGNILEFILPKYGLYNIKSASTTDITTHPKKLLQLILKELFFWVRGN